jgi:L-malate glycosyltransferase
MKHILYVLPYMNLGGTEKQAFSLMNSLQEHYHISLLAPDGLGAHPFRQAKFNYWEFPRLEKNLISGLRLFRQCMLSIHRQRPIDLVHIHAAHELTLLAKLFLPNVPVVFTVHGYHGRQSSFGYFLAAVFSNLFAEEVITISKSELQILESDRLQSSKINLVYNGVAEPIIDHQRVQQLADQFIGNNSGQITLGTAARLSEAKGVEYLLLAMAQLVDRHPYLKLVIAGDGELKESLQKMVNDLNISNYVVLTGYVQDVHNLMYSFDIFVLPSLQEPFGLVCAEAMSLHKPVVGTAVGGVPEQVLHGKTGFIVPPRDPESLATSLDKLISSPALIADFGEHGYQHYLNNFALPTMLHDTVDVYEKALSRTG